MNLDELFDKVSKQMLLHLQQIPIAIDNHSGAVGSGIEDTFREFLGRYFPKSLDIKTGFIVDINGKQSRQMDVIICDALKTPIFYESGETRVIPVECVYAVIEVKQYIDSNELGKIFQNMISIRSLEKKAYVRKYIDQPAETWELYGRDWDIWPINYFVFAQDSIDLKLIKEKMNDFYVKDNLPLSKRIDALCVMNKGIICNVDKNEKIVNLPKPDTHLKEIATNKPLLIFYGLLTNLFVASLPKLNYIEYLRKIQL